MTSMNKKGKSRIQIQYIYHSCFVAELEKHVLVFDYYKGTLPEFDKKKQILFFASHAHQDHFSRRILKLRDWYPELQFILSGDIRLSREEDGPDVHRMNPAEELCLEGVRIRTLASTDEGVAFLVRCEGRTLFHAGDLHWWHWEEESAEWNGWVRMAFRREVAKLDGEEIDVAFLVLDPRQGEAYYLGFDWFMRHTRTRAAFPMHMWEDYGIAERFLEREEAAPYRDRVFLVSRENQQFEITDSPEKADAAAEGEEKPWK